LALTGKYNKQTSQTIHLHHYSKPCCLSTRCSLQLTHLSACRQETPDSASCPASCLGGLPQFSEAESIHISTGWVDLWGICPAVDALAWNHGGVI